MKINSLNPYVRFARTNEKTFYNYNHTCIDHRIFMMESGSAKLHLNGKIFNLTKGDVVFWRSGSKYRMELDKNSIISGCNFDFIYNEKTNISIIPPIKATSKSKKLLETFTFEDTEALNDFFIINDAYVLKDKFHELYREFELKEILYEHRCSCILKDILLTCIRLLNTPSNTKREKVVPEILDYIKEHIQEPITNKTIAEKFHYHENYISNVIKAHTGLPLHKYITNYRIYIALDLLQSTDYSIQEISEKAGFSDISHFSKTFKKLIGYNPKHFRIK